MPILYENKVGVYVEELVPELMTVRQIKYAIERLGTRALRRGGGIGKTAIYDFNSLPEEVKAAYRKRYGNPENLVRKSVFETYLKVDEGAVKYFTDYRLEDGRPLPNEVRNEYIANASVLSTTLEVLKNRVMMQRALGKIVKATKANLINYVIENRERLRTKLPESHDAFAKKLNAFKSKGYEELISGLWGNQNGRLVDEEMVKLLNALFTQPNKPTATEVARLFESFKAGYTEVVNTDTGALYDPADFKPISKSTVLYYLTMWDNRVGTYLKRSGDKNRYEKAFHPHHWLERPKFSGSLISVDDRQPPFEYEARKRPWFYMGIDLHSECYIAWVYGKFESKNADFLMDFYRQLVRNCCAWGLGIPYELECEASLNKQLESTLLTPGTLFSSVRIHANAPNSKAIERYFGAMRYGFDKKREGFIARPFARSEANQSRGDYTGKNKQVAYTNIINNSLEDVETWNNLPHSQYPDRTRWEVWLEDQHPALQPPNWRLLLPYLGHEIKTSCHNAEVHLQGKKWLLGDEQGICTGDKLIQLMRLTEGKLLTAYWLDDNEGNTLAAICYNTSNEFCSHLYPKPQYQRATLEQTPDDLVKRELMTRYEQTIIGYGQRQKHHLEEVVVYEKPRTLNNKFKINRAAEPKRNKYDEDFKEDNEVEFFENEFEAAEALATITNDDDNPKKDFINRFTNNY